MRCSNKTCALDAMDGANYCELHLKLKGAPRPGVDTVDQGRERCCQADLRQGRSSQFGETDALADEGSQQRLKARHATFQCPGSLEVGRRFTGHDRSVPLNSGNVARDS